MGCANSKEAAAAGAPAEAAQPRLPAGAAPLPEAHLSGSSQGSGKPSSRPGSLQAQAEEASAPSIKPAVYDGPTQLVDTRSFENESERLRALLGCGVLDTAAEPRFDGITRLMSSIFQTPVALVSLVDDTRLWFKSVVGPFGSCVERDGSFCNYIMIPNQPEVLLVEDATQDARFSANPFVAGAPYIRFYAGAPLVGSRGHRFGTLCVVDTKPRRFTAEMLTVLTNFAELVVRELERTAVDGSAKPQGEQPCTAPTTASQELEPYRDEQDATQGVALIDVRLAGSSADNLWPVVYANEAWEAGTGLAGCEGRDFWDLFSPISGTLGTSRELLATAIAAGEPVKVTLQLAPSTGMTGLVGVELRPAANDALQANVPVGIPSWAESEQALRDQPAWSGRTSMEQGLPPREGVPCSFWFAVLTATLGTAGSTRPSMEGDLGSGDAALLPAQRRRGQLRQLPKYGLARPDAFKDVQLGPLLGSGSFGRVYRGTWRGGQVAVKILETSRTKLSSSDEMKGPLVEAILGRDMSHPNIVQTFDFASHVDMSDSDPEGGRELASLWIVSQFCNRGTLIAGVERGWLRVERSLVGVPDRAPTLQTLVEVASALAYLHENDVIHGDLSGNNVMLNDSARDKRRFVALVSDFGLARVASQGQVSTDTFGTVSHMPPELLCDGILTPATDVWSFGVIMWEVWSGMRAFAGKRVPTIIHLVTTGGFPLPIPESAPQQYQDLMRACLHADYKQRPPFVSVVTALEEMAAACVDTPNTAQSACTTVLTG